MKTGRAPLWVDPCSVEFETALAYGFADVFDEKRDHLAGLRKAVTSAQVSDCPALPVAFARRLVLEKGINPILRRRGNRRPAVAAAGGFLLLFMTPAWEAIPQFAEWISKVVMGAGAHGGGAATVINVDHYPKALSKVLKRPSLRIPIVIALITLGLLWWCRRRGAVFFDVEARVLAAITVSQLAQAVVVAKHPDAFYMIPSYMLSGLSIVLSVRLVWMAPALQGLFDDMAAKSGTVLCPAC